MGDLRTHFIQHKGQQFEVAGLHAQYSEAKSLIPDLYEPVLDGISTLAFGLRGYERHKAGDGDVFNGAGVIYRACVIVGWPSSFW